MEPVELYYDGCVPSQEVLRCFTIAPDLQQFPGMDHVVEELESLYYL